MLVRTCFDDAAAWDRLRAGVATPSPGDGFLAVVRVVDDPAYEGLSPAQLVALIPDAPEDFLFVADRAALADEEGPILVVPRVPAHWDEQPRALERDRAEFRVAVTELWGWRTTCDWPTWTGRSSPNQPTRTGYTGASKRDQLGRSDRGNSNLETRQNPIDVSR